MLLKPTETHRGTSEISRWDNTTERQGLQSAEMESFLFILTQGGLGENQFIRGCAFPHFKSISID